MTGRSPDADKARALRLASTAAKKAAKATSEQVSAMRFALEAGASLREISAATNIPHVTVKRIIERASS